MWINSPQHQVVDSPEESSGGSGIGQGDEAIEQSRWDKGFQAKEKEVQNEIGAAGRSPDMLNMQSEKG